MDIEWRDGDLGDRERRIKEYTLSDNVKAGLAWFIGISVNLVPLGVTNPYQSLSQLREHYKQQREDRPSNISEKRLPPLPLDDEVYTSDVF